MGRLPIAGALLGLMFACSSEEPFDIDNFDCGKERPGWIRAEAVTPNAVPPCNMGSTGTCPESGFEYVTGTGWCRPTEKSFGSIRQDAAAQ